MKIKTDNNKIINIKIKDINFFEYNLIWGSRTCPGIKIHMKDGTTYKTSFALDFKDIYQTAKKYNIPWQ